MKMIKQARAWAAQKAAAKPGAKKVKQNPNRSKGKSRKIWWRGSRGARSGMASSSRPTGTQYATVPHDPCPIQYLGDYVRSPFFVVSFFVTSPLWYLPPEAYARRRPGGGFRVPAAFSRASVPAAFTQGSGPEAVAGPSRNLMPNVGNWHGVAPIQQPQQPPSINVQVINVKLQLMGSWPPCYRLLGTNKVGDSWSPFCQILQCKPYISFFVDYHSID